MNINKTQKLILIIVILLIPSFYIFPPWKDSIFITKESHIDKFVGYSFIFAPPKKYQFQNESITKYNDIEHQLLKHLEKWKSLTSKEKVDYFYDNFSDKKTENLFSERKDVTREDTLFSSVRKYVRGTTQNSYINKEFKDNINIIDSLFFTKIDTSKIVGKDVSWQLQTEGFVSIYYLHLIIQVILLLITASLTCLLFNNKKRI